MVSKKRLDELKQILKKEYNLELNDSEVTDIGNTLVQYFDLLIQIDRKTKSDVK